MEKQPNLKFVMATLLVFLPSMALALANADVQVSMDLQDVYLPNQTIAFSYSFLSAESGIIDYSIGISCPLMPVPHAQIKTISVKKNMTAREFYVGSQVPADALFQACSATLRVLSPEVKHETKNFTVGSKMYFSFSLRLCKDDKCAMESKIFYKNEKVYVRYSSSIQDVGVTALVAYPDGATRNMDLPAAMVADQAGMYEIRVTASKPGYAPSSSSVQFAVSEYSKPQEISRTSVCNSNSICEEGENAQNCPTDCTVVPGSTATPVPTGEAGKSAGMPGSTASETDNAVLLAVVAGVAILAIAIVVILVIRRR